MALQLLGTNPVNFEDGWVSFAPFNAKAKEQYTPEIRVESANPELIYSYFLVRYQYPSTNQIDTVSMAIARIYYDTLWQFFGLYVEGNLEKNGNLVIQVRRFPSPRNLANLATTNVSLRVDPNDSFKPF